MVDETYDGTMLGTADGALEAILLGILDRTSDGMHDGFALGTSEAHLMVNVMVLSSVAMIVSWMGLHLVFQMVLS